MPSRDQSDYTRRLKYMAIVQGGGQGNINNRYTDMSSIVAMGNYAGRAFTAPTTTVPDTLVLRFDPSVSESYSGSGSTVTSIGTSRISGTMSNGVTYDSDGGGSFNFNGVDGTNISFPTYNFGSKFTVAAWVKPLSKVDINSLIANTSSGNAPNGFKLGWNKYLQNTRDLTFEGSYSQPDSGPGVIVYNEWQLITYVLETNNGTSSGSISFYKNNSQVGTQRVIPSPLKTTGEFRIGSNTDGLFATIGYVADLRVFSDTLTLSEITALYNSTKDRYFAVPAAPTISTVTPRNQGLLVSFIEGANNGKVITNYQYATNSGAGFGEWTSLSPPDITSPITIPSLTNGTLYTVKLRAVNSIGDGAESATQTGTPSGTPFAPTITLITPGNNSLNISFNAGLSGGSDITNYEYTTTNGTSWRAVTPVIPPSPFSIQFTSTTPAGVLSNGTDYPVQIRAVNVAGPGIASNTFVGTPRTFPAAPIFTSIGVGNQQLTLNFTAGSANGSPITNYEYSTNNGQDWISRSPANITSSPITITLQSTLGNPQLVNGDTYDVRIRAVNIAGPGAPSTMLEGTPIIPPLPNQPTLTYALPDNNAAYIYFTAGSGIVTNYEYSIDNGIFTALSPADILSPVFIPGLTNGVSKNIKLRAVNSGGNSNPSNELPVTPNNTAVIDPTLFYDPNDTRTYSGSGNSVNNINSVVPLTGTIQNLSGVIWSNGAANIRRKVFDFTGSSFIQFGQYNFGSSFTIIAWVYPRSKANINGILANGPPFSGTAPGFKVGWNYWSNPSTQNNVLLFEYGNDSNWGSTSSKLDTITLNTWQQVAYTYNIATQTAITYWNGIPADMTSIATVTTIDTNRSNFNIGAYIGGSYSMNGQLGSIKVYNSSFDAAQVYAEYNSTKGEFSSKSDAIII